MTSITSSIDDLLTSSMTPTQLPSMEDNDVRDAQTAFETPTTSENSIYSESETTQFSDASPISDTTENETENASNEQRLTSESAETDEYGNPTPPKRTYTQEEHDAEVNRAIRERLARVRNNTDVNQQALPQTPPQYAVDDPNLDPQQLLRKMIREENAAAQREQLQRAYEQQEQQRMIEFHQKMNRGMANFTDFESMVPQEHITPIIATALTGLNDPAGFLYSAHKLHPAEIKRIINLSNPYAQIVEIGKLDEKMRKQKPNTQTPRPLNKIGSDASPPTTKPKSREPTIEELCNDFAKRKLNVSNSRRR